jgi:hypothetical protein
MEYNMSHIYDSLFSTQTMFVNAFTGVTMYFDILRQTRERTKKFGYIISYFRIIGGNVCFEKVKSLWCVSVDGDGINLFFQLWL